MPSILKDAHIPMVMKSFMVFMLLQLPTYNCWLKHDEYVPMFLFMCKTRQHIAIVFNGAEY